jgi:hypothetical protein
VRRLRRRLGEIKILAGFWQSDPGQASELCAKTKADFCATRFRDALDGVGQKDVVIPFKELKVSTREGKDWLVLNRTKTN